MTWASRSGRDRLEGFGCMLEAGPGAAGGGAVLGRHVHRARAVAAAVHCDVARFCTTAKSKAGRANLVPKVQL
jgi:hypothetical protein